MNLRLLKSGLVMVLVALLAACGAPTVPAHPCRWTISIVTVADSTPKTDTVHIDARHERLVCDSIENGAPLPFTGPLHEQSHS